VIKSDRLAILAQDKFGVLSSKTAACVIRYQPRRVVCVIDSSNRGRAVGDVLGFGGAIPIVGSMGEALAQRPDALLVGIAPRGGLLPDAWRGVIREALEAGLNVLSGLHTMLGEDAEFSRIAAERGAAIWDVRKPLLPDGVSTGALKGRTGRVVLTVGSDCSTGKMTAAYELTEALKGRGVRAEFVPTGQTGVLLAGWGQAVDRVPGDFMSRVIEDLTLEALSRADVAVVEGQGSLIHPAYSGVTLAILHGCWPDSMVLCHQPSRARIDEFDVEIPGLDRLVEIYRQACRPLFESRVVALALNTYDLDREAAQAALAAAEAGTGLPAGDPVRFGPGRLCEAVEATL
jgi:uncharacterized NAD-dependent epimerase/dehydratase family protein